MFQNKKYFFRLRILFLFLFYFGSFFYANAQLVADFTKNVSSGCSPQIIIFKNTSLGNPDSCFWELGINNNTSVNCNPSAIYNTPGIYTVKLTVFKGALSSSTSQQIRIFKNPTANFDAIPRSGCVPFDVKFSDLSLQGDTTINSWTWDMGDGNVENVQNPLHTYTFSGNLNVSLIVTDKNGCSNTLTQNKFITKAVSPIIDFSVTNNNSCKAPLTVSFTSITNSSSGLSYLWKFGNGDSSTLKNPSYTYNALGSYDVSLVFRDSNNCSATVIKSNIVKILPLTVGFLIPNSICVGTIFKPTVFSSVSPFNTNWDFGHGVTSTAQVPTIKYLAASTYTIKLVGDIGLGCKDSVTKTILVNPKPTADFNADILKSCSPYSPKLTNLSIGGSSYNWIFVNKSNGKITTYTDSLPIVSPLDYGVYDVKLVAVSANSCTDTMTKSSYIEVVKDRLTAIASESSGCIPKDIKYTAVLTNNWIPTYINWDFDDGTSASGLTTTKTYSDTGSFTATITVAYGANCDTLRQTLNIKLGDKYPFSGSFDKYVVCVHKDTVSFVATGGIPTTQFTWLFGDGIDIGRNVSYVYQDPSEPNKYIVKLIAENNTCKDTIELDSIFVRYPKASFSLKQKCNSNIVTFTNNSEGDQRRLWDFGDGVIVNDSNVITHTFPNGASYNVKLIVYNDSSGCLDSMVQTVGFNAFSSNFVANKTVFCKPDSVQFTILNAGTSHNWDFGNGVTSTLASPLITYSSIGQFTVKLIEKNAQGCWDTLTKVNYITVVGIKPNFTYTRSGSCAPITINLSDASISASSPIISYQWEIQGAGSFSGKNVTATFNIQDSFRVRLLVTNSNGCVDSVIKFIKIPKPVANFLLTNNNVCTGTPISFASLSSGTGLSWFWDFGDGATSNKSAPVHTYTVEKNYDVKLVVTDVNGCKDSIIKPSVVQINNLHTDFLAVPRFKSCPDLITNFSVSPTNLNYTKLFWDFGNGNTSNDLNNTPQSIYTYADSFDVKLFVQDNRGCKDTVIKKDYIIVSGPGGNFTFAPDSGCLPLKVNFSANFFNTTKIFWDFGNGDTKTDTTLSKLTSNTYTNEGEFTPSVVLKDAGGCTVNLVSDKKVKLAKISSKITVDKPFICGAGATFNFTDSTSYSKTSFLINKFWSFSDSSISNFTGTTNHFTPQIVKGYNVVFTAISSFGCIAKDSVFINLYSLPKLTIDTNKLICLGEQIPIIASGPKYYNWTPAATLSNATIKNPIAKPTTTTTYFVTGYDTSFCPLTDSVTVVVKTKLNAKAYPDSFICIGDTIQLHAEGENTSLNTPTYSWVPASNITSTIDANPFVFPKQTTVYTVTVKNGLCSSTIIPLTIQVKTLPSVTAGLDKIIQVGMAIELDATSPNNVTYHWSPNYNLSCVDCQFPKAAPEVDTSYFVTVIDSFGCTKVDSLSLRIIEDCTGRVVFVPNTFTPNNDGQNDVLYVLGPGVASIKNFRIFNRWGQLVFETSDMNIGWDGNFKGERVNPDVYMYYLDVECINGKHTIKKGDVTLLR